MAVEKAPDRALGHPQAVHFFQMFRNLAQSDVRLLVDQRQYLLRMGLDPLRATIPALRPRPDVTRPTPPIDPFDRCRRGNPKTLSRRAPRKTAFNR